MKQMKIVIRFIIFLLFFVFLFGISNNVLAASSAGYTIEAYDININVNENNTFDITETITANFTGSGKHGIYRKIPLKNQITRLDGTKSNNRAKISNISVDNVCSVSNDSGYKVIKIGSSSRTVTGNQTYVISYTYDIGKDPLKDEDELYFNIIGNEWDTSISNVTFKITMPKEFDSSSLGFSCGSTGSTDSSNVEYNVNDNVIYGNLKKTLSENQALTVRLTLPEGYFVGTSENIDYLSIIRIAVSLIFVLIAYMLWKNYGKDDVVVETVEFNPPVGLNSADVGFIYKGESENQDVISLLIYLANKGYLKIEEYEETTLKIFKNRNFKIIKLKEYDGDNVDEKLFFNGLFPGSKTEITKFDLQDKFYLILNSIKKHMNRKENNEKIFEKSSLGKRSIIIIMQVILFFIMGGYNIIKIGESSTLLFILFILIAPLILVYKKSNLGSIILACITNVITSGFCFIITLVELGETMNLLLGATIIICSFSMIALIIFLAIMKKRTEYGNEMLGKIKGFKNFLEIAEKPKLEQLVEENPEYFYNILPYTYALGVSNKWMQKFEDIAIEPPTWYVGYGNFTVHSFNSFMNSTYSAIGNAMSSSPSENSGGGFSSGGSGGGGRRFLVEN